MVEKDVTDRFSKIIEDLERITELSRRPEATHRNLTLEDLPALPRTEMGPTVSLEYFRLVRLLAWHNIFGGSAKRLIYATGEKIGSQMEIISLSDIAVKIKAMGLARAEVVSQLNERGDQGKVVVKFFESAVTSGISLLGDQVCHFESGLLAGMLSKLYQRKMTVTETKCAAMGYDYCQFEGEFYEKRYSPRLVTEGETTYLDYSEYSEENIQLLSTLAAHAVTALENAVAYEQTRKMVITDPLTNTYNYGYFQVRLKEELQRSERQGYSFALVMADIDEFKHINDRYGHTAGDTVLKESARIMKEHIRGIDILCRYGGDEFAFILPQTDREETVLVMERIRQEIEKHNFGPATGYEIEILHLTASFGCSIYPQDSRFSEQLVEQSDLALYRAKKEGRNRVCMFSQQLQK